MKDLNLNISSSAKIAPTAILGENVIIGDNTEISDYAIIRDNVTIGSNCKIFPHAVIGENPQDYSFGGETSFVKIGDNNIIREFVTIHKAVGEGLSTVIGNNNMLMAYSHVAHNCKIGNKVTIANSTQLAGHVTINDNVVIGGLVAIHQGCSVGRFAMVSGLAASSKDLPPFFMYMGVPAIAIALNRIGLRRAGIEQKTINEIFNAYKIIYKSHLSLPSIIERLETELEQYPEIQELKNFIKDSKRGIKRTTGIHERWQS